MFVACTLIIANASRNRKCRNQSGKAYNWYFNKEWSESYIDAVGHFQVYMLKILALRF